MSTANSPMNRLDRIRKFVNSEESAGMSVMEPDLYGALAAIDELATRQDALLRVLQGLTGYMRNGWDDLPIWAVAPEENAAMK